MAGERSGVEPSTVPPTDAELLATVRAWLLAGWEQECRAKGIEFSLAGRKLILDSLPLSNVLSLAASDCLIRELNAQLVCNINSSPIKRAIRKATRKRGE